MKIAIYSRKSKLTDRGESIQNQIEMCKNYAYTSFSITENDIVIYEDEGYSGGTTDRPEFKRLMLDIKKKRYDAVMCYRLDRISRNVLDFSNILEVLNKSGTSFISITEHFDTTTPMGRAMVNIAAVFAQLERETIAERIRDNMNRLARTGRYIGSTPPFGFASEKLEYTDANGNKKKMHKLSIVDKDMDFVKLLYEKYLEFKGLSKVETWLIQNNYRNSKGNFIGLTELRRLLSNPVYVKADKSIYHYFVSVGTDVVNPEDEFDGEHGMLLYGRHDRTNSTYDPTKWTVVLAKHEGAISSDRWLSVQRILESNKNKAPRAGSSKKGLLTSKIKCGHCGAIMVLVYGVSKEIHYYKCKNKIKSRKTACDVKNINGSFADHEVFEYIKNLSRDNTELVSILKKQKPLSIEDEGAIIAAEIKIKKAIKEKEAEIKNMTAQLRDNHASTASKYIISEIEALDNELNELNNKIYLLNKDKENLEAHKIDEQLAINAILDFGKMADNASFQEKKEMIDKIIDFVLWDGYELAVHFR